MDLYLHIGTEKTGSSHLQSIAAVNRSILAQHGVYFPEGELEPQMQRWEISNGNAQLLTDLLIKDDFDGIDRFLQERKAAAERKQCQSVLLSNELLVLAMNNAKRVERFLQACHHLQFTPPNILLVIRDPVDQALSLYKHRAKGGTASDIEQWITQKYFYGKGLKQFFRAIEGKNARLTTRKYFKTKGYLDTMFFREWLKTTEALLMPDEPVNPSLNLSELLLIRQVNSRKPWLTQVLYNNLIKVPQKMKAAEPELESYYKYILYNNLKAFQQTWESCNQQLPPEEQLHFGPPASWGDSKPAIVATLSEAQCSAIAEFARQSASYASINRSILNKTKNWIARLWPTK